MYNERENNGKTNKRVMENGEREYIINAGTYKKIVVVDPRHLILFGN